MQYRYFLWRYLAFLLITLAFAARAEQLQLANESTTATFGPKGLVSIEDRTAKVSAGFAADGWAISIDGTMLRSEDAQPEVKQDGPSEIAYRYTESGYQIDVLYRLKPGRHFVSKQLKIVTAPNTVFKVQRVVPLDTVVQDPVSSVYVPSSYLPQLGATIEQSRNALPGKDFGAFLRMGDARGVMLLVQNPYLEIAHQGNAASLAYAPDMEWKQVWGEFSSDVACIGPYRPTGQRLPREMVLEWHPSPETDPDDGMDRAEIAAFTDCVRAFLIHPASSPTRVEVGWTLNDYQVDVGTPEGKAEYKRIIDSASSLGIHSLLYAPGNSRLSDRTQSVDSWGWEYVLWLNLGQKIRKGTWDPATGAVPSDVSEMVAYAKSKQVGLLAYVYPSVPYEANPSWLVKTESRNDHFTYATLASREFQDYLLRKLIAFQRRTGIAGYSFDYAFFNLPGSSSYSQWFGWRRVMEELRRAVPGIVIDGRQSYQEYGPWSWLAGSYPHPTGNDEQPESFKPYPDLHFDRVSADRARFINYWYRNYQFAPSEIIPGYATHQTERSMNVAGEGGKGNAPEEKMMYTRYLPRDWDYLGYRYSFLSSIATGGWNNVVDMIPARDPEEWSNFSAADKAWIRSWLEWTTEHKEYLRNTRTILGQPALGSVDGTSAILGDRGFIFLFNPNYAGHTVDLALDETSGITQGERYELREIYPFKGRLLGKPGAGVWNRGDKVRLKMDGTSALVLELAPAQKAVSPILFNACCSGKRISCTAELRGDHLTVRQAEGEPGISGEIGVLLPPGTRVAGMSVNGRQVTPVRAGNYVSAEVKFSGERFAQAQEIALAATDGGLAGSFGVPQRIFDQLAARKRAWPISWTKEDYDTTWLVPERLLLFVQFAEGTDSIPVSVSLDGKPLALKAAYGSVRIHRPSFVGFYADVSKIPAGKQHHLELKLQEADRAKLQGVFFDNVEPELTNEIVP